MDFTTKSKKKSHTKFWSKMPKKTLIRIEFTNVLMFQTKSFYSVRSNVAKIDSVRY
jgi:hypothetical protein